jgi:hypothetical protein
LIAEFLLVAAVGGSAVLAVVATVQLLLGGRHWERMAFMAWGALFPIGAVVAAFFDGHLVLGR